MRKFLLGAVATAAIIAPLALAATSAEAVTTKSAAADCTPIFEKAAVAEVNHTEYKYVPVVGTGHIQVVHCGRADQGLRRREIHGGVRPTGVCTRRRPSSTPRLPRLSTA